jgi:hypothetical protein
MWAAAGGHRYVMLQAWHDCRCQQCKLFSKDQGLHTMVPCRSATRLLGHQEADGAVPDREHLLQEVTGYPGQMKYDMKGSDVVI